MGERFKHQGRFGLQKVEKGLEGDFLFKEKISLKALSIAIVIIK